MKRHICLLVVLLFTAMAFSQTQQGFVKTKGRMVNGQVVPGQGLKGAMVTVKGSTPVIVKSDDGAFSFPIPAQTFMVQSVQKNGFELVDADAIRMPYSYSSNPIYLVMETPEQQTQDQLDSERKIRRTLQRQLQQREDEIEALKETQKITIEEYQQALQKLYADQENNEKLIADMAKQYARMDYDQMDELNQRISDAILNGRLTEADSLLRSKGDINERIASIRKAQQAEAEREDEIAREQAELAASKAGTQKQLEDVAEDCYKYYDLCQLHLDFDSAAYYIMLRAELDTANLDWQFEAANFMDHQCQYQKSEAYYLRALKIARSLANDNPQVFDYDVALILNNMAILYEKMYRYKESKALLDESLEICRLQAKNQSATYTPLLSIVLSNLADLAENTFQFSESEVLYREAIDIMRHLVEEIPEIELSLASTLCSFGSRLCIDDNEKLQQEGREMVEEAVEIIRRWTEKDPEAYKPKLVSILLKYAKLCNRDYTVDSDYYDDSKGCESIYKDALEISRKCAKDNPQAYDPMYSATLQEVAGFYLLRGRYDDCERMYRKNLEVARRMVKNNPEYFEYSLAKALNALGYLLIDMQEYADAIPYYEEALIYYKRKRDGVSRECATVMDDLCRLYITFDDYAEAYQVGQELVTVSRKVFNEESRVTVLTRQAYCGLFLSKFSESEQLAREALTIKPMEQLAFCFLAPALLFQGKYTEAEQLYRQYKDELKEDFLSDFNAFETAGVIPEERKADVEKIRKMLSE